MEEKDKKQYEIQMIRAEGYAEGFKDGYKAALQFAISKQNGKGGPDEDNKGTPAEVK